MADSAVGRRHRCWSEPPRAAIAFSLAGVWLRLADPGSPQLQMCTVRAGGFPRKPINIDSHAVAGVTAVRGSGNVSLQNLNKTAGPIRFLRRTQNTLNQKNHITSHQRLLMAGATSRSFRFTQQGTRGRPPGSMLFRSSSPFRFAAWPQSYRARTRVDRALTMCPFGRGVAPMMACGITLFTFAVNATL